MKLTTPEKECENLSSRNEDFSLLNKHTTSVEPRRTPKRTKCDCNWHKQVLTILIALILLVLGKIRSENKNTYRVFKKS